MKLIQMYGYFWLCSIFFFPVKSPKLFIVRSLDPNPQFFQNKLNASNFRQSIIESSFIVKILKKLSILNFKILSILTFTFNCGFPCALGLEKLQKMARCNKVLIISTMPRIWYTHRNSLQKYVSLVHVIFH